MALIFVEDTLGNRKEYMEREFYIKIMRAEDYSKWCAPINEMVRVVRDPNFSLEYTIDLCAKAIDTFTQTRAENEISMIEREALQQCYKILAKCQGETAKVARRKYEDWRAQ